MSNKNIRSRSRLPDPDMQAAPAALQRAAQRARELAARTRTAAVDGNGKGGKVRRSTTEHENQ